MAGRVIRVLPLTSYDWAEVAAGGEVSAIVGSHIDVSQYRHATLAVRAHSLTIPGDGTVSVQVAPDGHTQQDPSLQFLDGNAAQAIDITASDEAPYYRTLEVTAGRMGAMLTIVIAATMDSTQSQTMNATLSVDLVLKD